jgi:predicted dehydrogenase
MADIGTHAFNLSEYITGLQASSLFASLNRVVNGRLLDDDGTVILKFNKGATGSLLASQVAVGEENNLRIKIYGTLGGLEWEQMNPNSLVVHWADRPYEVYRTASGYLSPGSVAGLHSRLPSGHPEGFIEAFANLYRNFALAVKSKEDGKTPDDSFDFPSIHEGVRGMRFLEAVVKSDNAGSWVALQE